MSLQYRSLFELKLTNYIFKLSIIQYKLEYSGIKDRSGPFEYVSIEFENCNRDTANPVSLGTHNKKSLVALLNIYCDNTAFTERYLARYCSQSCQ